MHEYWRIPAYSQSRETVDVMNVHGSFTFSLIFSSRKKDASMEGWWLLWTANFLGPGMKSAFGQLSWSQTWCDLMCTSVIYLEFCSHREGIRLCCNWNILSCTCLDLDICLADKLVDLRFFSVELDDQNSLPHTKHYLWITPTLASRQMCLVVFAKSNSVHSYFQMLTSFVKFSSNSTNWPKTNSQVRLNQYI